MSIVNDMVAGGLGGALGVLVGAPLDVVKARIQAGLSSSPSTGKALADLVRSEGPRSLFRGVLPPLLGNIPVNALFFGLWAAGARQLDDIFPREIPQNAYPKPGPAEKEQLLYQLQRQHPNITMQDIDITLQYPEELFPRWSTLFASGCISGLLGAALITPMELIKIKEQNYIATLTSSAASHAPAIGTVSSQIQSTVTPTPNVPNSTTSLVLPKNKKNIVVPSCLDIARSLVKENPRALFQGFAATAIRDFPSCGVYFLIYEYTKYLFRKEKWQAHVIPPSNIDSFFQQEQQQQQHHQQQQQQDDVIHHDTISLSNIDPIFQQKQQQQHQQHDQVQIKFQYQLEYSTLSLLFAGSLGGVASWISTFPADVLKTRAQTLTWTQYQKHGKLRHVFRDTIQQNGIRSLFAGLAPTVLRSIPSSAVTFAAYWKTLEFLHNMNDKANPVYFDAI